MGKRKARRIRTAQIYKANSRAVVGNNSEPKEQRTVQIIKDSVLTFPQLYLEVLVIGDDFEQQAFAPLFARAMCSRAKSIETADLVVFTGGVDVDPALYGAKPHPLTERPDPARDQADIEAYAKCLHLGVPMLGICRGAQFLCVMNGGKLYQHVDNHNGNHVMWDLRNKMMLEKVSSVHHQMVMADVSNGMEIIATASKARVRHIDANKRVEGTQADVEAFFYPDTACIGIQGHPEYQGYNHFAKWSMDLIEDLICENPRIGMSKGYRRLKTVVEIVDTPLQSITYAGVTE